MSGDVLVSYFPWNAEISNANSDSLDLANVNRTFLRGLQPTEVDGVAQFRTKFPGHYSSRATHIHIRKFTVWVNLFLLVPGKKGDCVEDSQC